MNLTEEILQAYDDHNWQSCPTHNTPMDHPWLIDDPLHGAWMCPTCRTARMYRMLKRHNWLLDEN